MKKKEKWNRVNKLMGVVAFTAVLGLVTYYYRSHDIIADFIVPTLHLFK